MQIIAFPPISTIDSSSEQLSSNICQALFCFLILRFAIFGLTEAETRAGWNINNHGHDSPNAVYCFSSALLRGEGGEARVELPTSQKPGRSSEKPFFFPCSFSLYLFLLAVPFILTLTDRRCSTYLSSPCQLMPKACRRLSQILHVLPSLSPYQSRPRTRSKPHKHLGLGNPHYGANKNKVFVKQTQKKTYKSNPKIYIIL